MTRISLSKNGNSAFEKLIGHNSAVLEKWNALENSLFVDTDLDAHLLEQVRRTVAFENNCEYCMLKAGRPDVSATDRKVGTACAFAQLFASDHDSINEKHFEMLKEDFSDKEISELCSFIAFICACQKLGNIYNLTKEYQPDALVSMEHLNE